MQVGVSVPRASQARGGCADSPAWGRYRRHLDVVRLALADRALNFAKGNVVYRGLGIASTTNANGARRRQVAWGSPQVVRVMLALAGGGNVSVDPGVPRVSAGRRRGGAGHWVSQRGVMTVDPRSYRRRSTSQGSRWVRRPRVARSLLRGIVGLPSKASAADFDEPHARGSTTRARPVFER